MNDEPPFPPPFVTRFFAYALTLVAFPLLTFWWGGENTSEELRDRYLLSGFMFLGALVPAWLAYIWTRQAHYDHATGAFVLSVGIVAASLLVALV